MTYPSPTSGPLALRAALAIIHVAGNPTTRPAANPVTAGELARIIQGEINITVLRKAIDEAMGEIEYGHADMLTEDERSRPRGGGWARVYDKLARARDLLEGEPA